MIAPLKVSQNHIAASFLTASMQLSAATGVNRRSLLCLSGNGMWLHGAGNNDLLRRTSGCCETHLLFWHSGRSAGIPNTLSDLCDDLRLRWGHLDPQEVLQ